MKKYILLIVAGVFLIMPIFIYFIIFSDGISFEHAYWEQFGTIWGGVVGSAISGVALILVILGMNESEKNNIRQKEEDLFMRQIEIYYKQIERLHSTNLGENRFSFKVFNTEVANQIKKNFSAYLNSYYVTIEIYKWPLRAMEYFVKYNKEYGDYVEILKNVEEPYYLPDEKKREIAENWTMMTEAGKREYLKGVFEQHLKNRKMAEAALFSFVNECINQITVNMYNLAYERAYEMHGSSISTYLKNHVYTVKSIKRMNDHKNRMSYYLNQLTNDELEMLYYYNISYDCSPEIMEIHREFNFWHTLGEESIFGIYTKEKAEGIAKYVQEKKSINRLAP